MFTLYVCVRWGRSMLVRLRVFTFELVLVHCVYRMYMYVGRAGGGSLSEHRRNFTEINGRTVMPICYC